MSKPVVVGIDGSPGAAQAVQYAAQLAARRNTSLVVAHVYENLFYGYGPLTVAGNYAMATDELREAGEKMLADVVGRTQMAHPRLAVESLLREGNPAAYLIEESKRADVTVVGARGVGGFAGVLLGSVATQVAAHGDGAVVVVRETADPTGPVLVAYDGSAASDAALAYAAAEAVAQNQKLVVSNVYWPEAWGFGDAPVEDPEGVARAKAEQLVADGLQQVRQQYPELAIETRVLQSMGPAYSLVEESEHASLTVVGCRGRGGFAGLLLGSVSRVLVTHAQSPVAVLHAEH